MLKKKISSVVLPLLLAGVVGSAHAESYYNPDADTDAGGCREAWLTDNDWYQPGVWSVPALGNGQSISDSGVFYTYSTPRQQIQNNYPITFTCNNGTITATGLYVYPGSPPYWSDTPITF